jgi:small-conductance mechanosensitive channel
MNTLSRDDIMLARLLRDLDDILRRAQELAAWIVSAFEPETSRLSREIAEARKRKSFPPPADVARPQVERYDFRRRTTT